MIDLPEPEVVDCFFDDSFAPPLAAMCLHWGEGWPSQPSLWCLPGQVQLISRLPDRFGLRVRRTGADAYQVSLLWNKLAMAWSDLPRVEVLHGSLEPLVAALGTDLGHILGQPIVCDKPRRAA